MLCLIESIIKSWVIITKNVFHKNVCFLQGFDFGKLNDGVTIAQKMCGSTLVALTILIYDDSNLRVWSLHQPWRQ